MTFMIQDKAERTEELQKIIKEETESRVRARKLERVVADIKNEYPDVKIEPY